MIRLILFLALTFQAFAQFTFRDVGLGGMLNRSASGPAYLSGDELTGLIAYYRMDGASGANEIDRAGAAYNLTAVNTVQNVGSIAGIITNARTTSIIGQNYLAQNNTVFSRPGQDWTWIGWLKVTTLAVTEFPFAKYDGGFDNSQFAIFLNPGGGIELHTFGNHEELDGCCTPFTVYTESIVASSVNLTVDAWCFVAFGVSGGDIFISVNGANMDIAAMTDAMQAGADPELRLGTYGGNLNNFIGGFDECGYYSVALSQELINSIYNGGVGKTIAP